MNNLWRVALHEFRRNVFKKSFIWVMLSVPLMMTTSIGMGFFIEFLQQNDAPVGYLDEAGLFPDEVRPVPVKDDEEPLEFIAFETDEAARQALEAGQIQAYFTLTEDYAETRYIMLAYLKNPGNNARHQFWDFLQLNMLTPFPKETSYRAAVGSDVIVRSLNGDRIVPGGGPTLTIFMPILITIAFMAMILMTSGYLLSAVGDEKENRTIEVLVTSISPFQLLGGKVAGIVGIGLALMTFWLVVVLAGVFTGTMMGISWFMDFEVDWSTLIALGAIALPAYVLVCGLMATLGAMATTTQEGQSISAIFIILHVIPIYTSWIFISNPNSSLAVLLSLMPFTSLVAVGLRSIFSVVPMWQIMVSVVIQSLGAVFAVWMAGRAFRLGMLRYGQRLTWRGLFKT